MPIKLDEDEDLVLKVHHYFLVFIPHLLITFLIIVLDFFLLFVLFKQGQWGVYVFLAILLICILYVLRIIFFWYKNSFVITSKRLIDFDQQGLFKKQVSDLSFEKIRDVSYSIRGIWQTMHKYGNVQIQLEGTDRSFELFNIKDPEDIQKLISELIRKFKPTEQVLEDEDNEEGERETQTDNSTIEEVLAKIGSLNADEQKKVYEVLKKNLFGKQEESALKSAEKAEEKPDQKDKFLEDYWKQESI